MPTSEKPTSETPLSDLATTLGARPPASLADLDPAVLTVLTSAIEAQRRRQQQALGQAVDHALHLIPRPLRGLVRRMLTS